jgi:vacuolar protein sorting-associated protein 13A/C
MPYAWDFPAETNKQLQIVIGGRGRIINLLEIGSQIRAVLPLSLSEDPR